MLALEAHGLLNNPLSHYATSIANLTDMLNLAVLW